MLVKTDVPKQSLLMCSLHCDLKVSSTYRGSATHLDQTTLQAVNGSGRNSRACGGHRTARAVLEKGDAVATGKVVSGLLRNMTVNLWGLGATVIGLQARLSPHLHAHIPTKMGHQHPHRGPWTARQLSPEAMEINVLVADGLRLSDCRQQ